MKHTNAQICQEINLEPICEHCGRRMTLHTFKCKNHKHGKTQARWECVPSCGNIVRKRTFNEVLRDLGEIE